MIGAERWSFQREVFGVLYYGMFLDYLWPLDADEALEDPEQTDTSGL
jgi:hypothetical protein